MKLAYAACRLIGISDADVPSPSSPVNDFGHRISRLPRSSRYTASSGSSHTLPRLSAFPAVLKYWPRGFGTHTQLSGCMAAVALFALPLVVVDQPDPGPSGA
jgi:hypothetical protein